MGATERALFLDVYLPGALPQIVTGLTIGMGGAWSGAGTVASTVILLPGQILQRFALQIPALAMGIPSSLRSRDKPG